MVGSIGDMATIISAARRQREQRSFLLQRAQPAMVGLIDGSLSTLAPIFAVAFATHQPRYAFLAGLATAIGAGVSMAFSEGLSDTGDLTGGGSPVLRGAITGFGTFLGGVLHTLPFLIPRYRPAVLLALVAMAFELLILAWIRRRFLGTRLSADESASCAAPKPWPGWPDSQAGKACRSRTAISFSTSDTGRGSSTAKRKAPDEVEYPRSSSLSCEKTEPL
jgi:erythrin-vacuolar iron transport family protein